MPELLKGKKRLCYYLLFAAAALLIAFFRSSGTPHVSVQVTDTCLELQKSGEETCRIELTDIEAFELLEHPDYASLAAQGRCLLNEKIPVCIRIRTGTGEIFLNYENERSTRSLYEAFREQL